VDTSASETRPDRDRLLELIGDTESLLEIEQFRHELLHAIVRAVPADWISLNDIGPDPGTTEVLIEPAQDAEAFAGFARYAHQNPLVHHYNETRDARALRISDVTTQAAFHALEIYTEVYGPMGMEYQIAFTLPHTRDRILGVALSRRESDFSDAERDLLERARPFLIQAYRNAVRYSEALATPSGLPAVPSAVPAVVPSVVPSAETLRGLGLTPRQADAIRLLATGAGEAAIATSLGISLRTLQKHLQLAYRRLGVRNRSQAAAAAWATIDQSAAAD
jgi:DNA-binding CsgD family transcriptional regulator